jgi:hypothetical protein
VAEGEVVFIPHACDTPDAAGLPGTIWRCGTCRSLWELTRNKPPTGKPGWVRLDLREWARTNRHDDQGRTLVEVLDGQGQAQP